MQKTGRHTSRTWYRNQRNKCRTRRELALNHGCPYFPPRLTLTKLEIVFASNIRGVVLFLLPTFQNYSDDVCTYRKCHIDFHTDRCWVGRIRPAAAAGAAVAVDQTTVAVAAVGSTKAADRKSLKNSKKTFSIPSSFVFSDKKTEEKCQESP